MMQRIVSAAHNVAKAATKAPRCQPPAHLASRRDSKVYADESDTERKMRTCYYCQQPYCGPEDATKCELVHETQRPASDSGSPKDEAES